MNICRDMIKTTVSSVNNEMTVTLLRFIYIYRYLEKKRTSECDGFDV